MKRRDCETECLTELKFCKSGDQIKNESSLHSFVISYTFWHTQTNNTLEWNGIEKKIDLSKKIKW